MLEDFWSVCVWTLLWFGSYKFVYKNNVQYCAEYSCRVITLTHAVVITAVSFYFLFIVGPWPFESVGIKNTDVENKLISCSLGYFLYDFGWCLYYKSEGPLMLFHHVVSIVAMVAALAIGKSAIEILGTTFGSENTSIVLNIRWFLKYKDLYDNTMAGKVVDILFVMLFISMRICLGGYFTYCVMKSANPTLMFKFAGCLMYLVNLLFLTEIISFSRYQLKKWSKPRIHKKQNGNIYEKVKTVGQNGHIQPKT